MPPSPTLAGFGVTAIESRDATFRVAVPLTPLSVAVMTEDPCVTPVASPVPAPMVATLIVPELHAT